MRRDGDAQPPHRLTVAAGEEGPEAARAVEGRAESATAPKARPTRHGTPGVSGRTPKIEWESHEGMVTVYYHDGRYAGCMGIDRWRRLLRDDDENRVIAGGPA